MKLYMLEPFDVNYSNNYILSALMTIKHILAHLNITIILNNIDFIWTF